MILRVLMSQRVESYDGFVDDHGPMISWGFPMMSRSDIKPEAMGRIWRGRGGSSGLCSCGAVVVLFDMSPTSTVARR